MSTSRPFRFAVQSYTATSAHDWRAQVRHAEALGFDAFHVADHVIGRGPALKKANHPVQDVAAIPAMAVALEATERIKVGARVFCVDYRNPAVFAKEIATLDMFAEGRLEVGLGAGWMASEYEAIGVPFDRPGMRISRLDEIVALLRSHYSGKEIDLDGDHVTASGFVGEPRPSTTPPPLMIGGGAQRILGLAGREADIVSLNFNNDSGALGQAGFASSTDALTAQKIEWIAAGAAGRMDDIELEIGAYVTVVTNTRDTVLDQMGSMLGLDRDAMAQHPHAAIGTVDEICDQLVARRDRFGISYITFGYDTIDAIAPVVERLAGQ